MVSRNERKSTLCTANTKRSFSLFDHIEKVYEGRKVNQVRKVEVDRKRNLGRSLLISIDGVKTPLVVRSVWVRDAGEYERKRGNCFWKYK